MAVKHLPAVGWQKSPTTPTSPPSPLGPTSKIPTEEPFYRNAAALFGLPR
jgi:hypothetical protein